VQTLITLALVIIIAAVTVGLFRALRSKTKEELTADEFKK